MPQVDVQWPSEDEDFDARTGTNGPAKTMTKAVPTVGKTDKLAPSGRTNLSAGPVTNAPGVSAGTSATKAAQPDPDPVVEREAAVLAAGVDNDPAAISQITVNAKSSKLPRPRSLLRMAGEAVLVALVAGLGLWSWSLYNDRNNLQSQVDKLNANPQSIVQKQTQALISKVGSLMQLPSGETPTVAEVSNAAQAKQQSAFFDNAQNGDRVLMYVKAGEAILYRPSTNKIVLVAPLVFNNTGASSTSSTTSKTSTTSTAPKTTGTTSTSSTGTSR